MAEKKKQGEAWRSRPFVLTEPGRNPLAEPPKREAKRAERRGHKPRRQP